MNEYLYSVVDEHGSVIVKDMTVDNAMILVRALFVEYLNEEDIAYTVKRQKETSVVEK